MITKSSSESTKASRNPDRIAGAISGRVTLKNATTGLANRSCAASSSERSNPWNLARTMTATNGMLKPMCESRIVVRPSAGVWVWTNSVSSEEPRTISGTAIAMKMTKFVGAFPRKR